MEQHSPKQKKQNNIIIGVLIGIIVLILLWKYVIKPAMDKSTVLVTDPSTGTKTSLPTTKTLPKLGNDATLKSGTKAQEVQWVQYYYNSKLAAPIGKPKLAEDGAFGPKTLAAVKSVTGGSSTTWTQFKAKVDSGTKPSAASSNSTTSFLAQYYDTTPDPIPWGTAPLGGGQTFN
jgi:hypothetical protein